SMYLGTAATVFQVTRLTEASFIVSTPMLATGRTRRELTGSSPKLARRGQPTKVETRGQEVTGGVRLTIEMGAESPIGIAAHAGRRVGAGRRAARIHLR